VEWTQLFYRVNVAHYPIPGEYLTNIRQSCHEQTIVAVKYH